MKSYIGIKSVEAEPCTQFEFIRKYRPEYNCTFQPGNPDTDGYLIKYPDGYVSWSPKQAFEEAYVDVNSKCVESYCKHLKVRLNELKTGTYADDPDDVD